MCSSKFKPLNGGVDKSIVVKADFILAGCASMCRNSVLYPKLFENVWMSLDLHKGRIYDNFDKVNGVNTAILVKHYFSLEQSIKN